MNQVTTQPSSSPGYDFDIVEQRFKNDRFYVDIRLQSGSDFSDTYQSVSLLINNRSQFKGKFAVDAYMPPYLKIDHVLAQLKSKDLVQSWSMSKAAAYIIFLTDSDRDDFEDLQRGFSFSKQDKYRSTATTLIPESPSSFKRINMTEITLEDLQHLARRERDYYINNEGLIEQKVVEESSASSDSGEESEE